MKIMNSKNVGAIIAGACVVVGLLTLFTCGHRIPAGYVGVVYDMNGGVKDGVLSQGFKFIWPSENVTKYSIATEQGYLSKDKKDGDKEDNSFECSTNDGQKVSVDLEYSYHFDEKTLPKTFNRFKGLSGNEIEKTFMRGKLKSWTQESTSKYSVMEVYSTKKTEVNQSITKHLQEKFKEYGIDIDTANLSRADLDSATSKIIHDRIAVEQSIEKSKLEKQQADIDAQKKLIVAQGDANAKVAAANGEAEANAKLIQNVTPELVQYKSLEVQKAQADAMAKWPLTTYISGSGNTPMINIPSK